MKTWTVCYTRIPTNYNDDQSALVEAETAEDARELVRRQLGDDRVSLSNYVIRTPVEYAPKPIAGRVVTLKGGA